MCILVKSSANIFAIFTQAAAFGKSFLQDMRPQVFVDMCQMIRVMNNVRDFKVGIPITYDQYPFNCLVFIYTNIKIASKLISISILNVKS